MRLEQMMHILNNWHDYLRVIGILHGLWVVILLLLQLLHHEGIWSTNNRDYWYALLMWTLAGTTALAQGIFFDRPFTPGTALILAAVLVTAKGVYTRGNRDASDA